MIDYDSHSWLSHLFDIKGSMVKEIVGRVTTCVFWSFLVVLFHRYVHPVSIASTVHSLVGVALGLLLVFRTNVSYDRFWEARKLWGSIINESRNMARSARAMIRDDPALAETIVRWTVAFAHATMHSLRGWGSKSLGPVAWDLPKEEVEASLASAHVPMDIANRMTARLVEARDRGLISDYVMLGIDRNIQLLVDYLGACERIQKTPLPFAYVVHLRRALILYCFTLPFALVNDFGWGTVLDTLFVSYIFFGIEEIGVEIEDPFGRDDNDLPLENLCSTIENNLLTRTEEVSLVTQTSLTPGSEANLP